jgi:hypothetical protein
MNAVGRRHLVMIQLLPMFGLSGMMLAEMKKITDTSKLILAEQIFFNHFKLFYEKENFIFRLIAGISIIIHFVLSERS